MSDGAKVTAALERVATLLRARGDRMTRPRRAVLTVLAAECGHLTADQVVNAVGARDPAIHRASVYRTLDTLTALGVVQHVHVGHGTTTYQLVDGEPHLHAQCQQCGTVLDLPALLLDGVAARLLADHGFALDGAHVALSGRCERCSADFAPLHQKP